MERYNEYKDSGVQWLGEIPSHWEVVRLKSVIKDSQSGVWGEDPKHDGSDTLCLRVADFNYNNGYLKEDNLTYRNYGKELSSNKQLQMRDLLLEKSGGGDLYPVGRVVRYNFNGIVATCSNFIQKLTPRDNVDSDFIYYLFRTMYYLKVNGLYYNQTTGIQNLKVKEYLSQTVFLPPLSEQQAIANYLDTATAKIDEAIAQQQKMIDLLNERKQIIINNAVTKGLNPDAPMKDSGVDYIGLIPEHWVVRRMASLGVFSKGGGISRDNLLEEGEPAILYGDIYTKYNYFAEDIKNHVSKKVALASVEVHKNELLMTGSGETKEDIGKTIVFLGNKAYAGGDVIIFKQDNNNSSFLSYALNSSYAKNFRYKESKGEIVVHIYANAVRQLYLALPDITEQNSIVEYLNNKVGIIDSEICVVRKQISLLQERKQIIINDVVTGKVKVS